MLPREKLQQFGLNSLSNNELIAIILRHGNRRESVFQLSNRILSENGFYTFKATKTLQDCQKRYALGPTQAAQLMASIELGRRLFKSPEKKLQKLSDLEEYLGDMKNLKKEVFRGLYVSSSLEILADEVISIGSLDKNIVHPREIFAPALENRAYGLFIAHNHPSGSSEPSDEDIQMTLQIKKAADIMQIKLLDHIIIARQGLFSFQHAKIIA